MRYRTQILLCLAVLTLAYIAGTDLAEGTPYWSLEDMSKAELQGAIDGGTSYAGPFLQDRSSRFLSPGLETPDYLEHYTLLAGFLRGLQVWNPGGPDHGGMREGEHLPDIIETDNTAEAIWVWSHYYELTGDDSYYPNVEAAWEYCMAHPAYNEEGPPPGPLAYYKVYNCAWALAAEVKYRNVYADTTYLWYSDTCATFIIAYPLDVHAGAPYFSLNAPVLGWAVGNLYSYGMDVGSTAYQEGAVELGDSVRTWIEEAPVRLAIKYWAMSGGAPFWGVLNSCFRMYPDGERAWATEYGPYLDTEVYSGQFQNAYRGWYALGHDACWEATADTTYKRAHVHLADTLVLNDGDVDGGIPASDPEPDNQDQSWVSNYLGYMGLDILIPVVDVAIAPDTTVVPRGGTLGFLVSLANNTDAAQAFYGQTEAYLPNGQPYAGNPLIGPLPVALQPLQVRTVHFSHSIPLNAPLGTYHYRVKIGTPPNTLIDEEEFAFTVTE
ncbi:hypothetical protein AMJ39_02620 [candidate division TA06 bacterium DG_24]|uniref:Uncharacterized protein n=3 Tax=Bacteria division TA06 TaxID=1156500 RepID=A0A0S8JPT7_UNCT6|nr:MAG: hypothetical protein AMJ39_02620 [candidate division TA06 bacterium DG_24]KPK71347.1 MAG: hypothetical protein AMJ82_01110 [candidate division TA06 bacterium SM23_40]KPL10622.1 MAG: hypothetical protein AMJ71_02525 [candidate division TA06 bacterium SM1_40]